MKTGNPVEEVEKKWETTSKRCAYKENYLSLERTRMIRTGLNWTVSSFPKAFENSGAVGLRPAEAAKRGGHLVSVCSSGLLRPPRPAQAFFPGRELFRPWILPLTWRSVFCAWKLIHPSDNVSSRIITTWEQTLWKQARFRSFWTSEFISQSPGFNTYTLLGGD